MSIYHHGIKPYMFRRDAEEAHQLTMQLMRNALAVPGIPSFFKAMYTLRDDRLKRHLMGLTFPNPIGLAAGFDKDGKYIDLLPYLGFGFAEIGTVTPRPQPGNEKPRLFRLPTDEALINRMGFNNDGVEAMARRLEQRKNRDLIIGGNIGKNKDTPNAEAYRDYITCFEALQHLVDFFVINVSSPNTPGLRELQNKESLHQILGSIQERNDRNIPVLLKVAPDMETGWLEDIISVVEATGLTGVISHNTTIRRDGLATPAAKVKSIGAGGLSGKPLSQLFPEKTTITRKLLSKEKVLIASGGVWHPEIAKKHFNEGADLVEIYTGLIYRGPGFVKNILRTLLSQK